MPAGRHVVEARFGNTPVRTFANGISVVPADQEPNTVVALLQKGYLIADRVLRPALVTVSASA